MPPDSSTTDTSTPERPLNRKILKSVMDVIHLVAKERAEGLDLHSNVMNLGLDSMERMEIVAALEKTFGGRFPDDTLLEIETCAEITAAVQQYLGDDAPDDDDSEDSASGQIVDDGIPAENYRFEALPEYRHLKLTLGALTSSGEANPYFQSQETAGPGLVKIGDAELVNFASYDYLGLASHPDVSAAAKDAVDQYGTSVSASRLVSGEKPIHGQLERSLADFIGVDDSIVFVSGHGAGESTVGHLFGPGDLVLYDAQSEQGVVQGARLSGAKRMAFPHNDWQTVDEILTRERANYRRVVIAIEGVYAIDGDLPELNRFVEIKEKHQTFLLLDEAHSIGVLGANGRGACEHFNVDPRKIDLHVGSMGNALGSSGGYIAGCKELIEYLKYTAPAFVFAAGLTPSTAAATHKSLDLIQEDPDEVLTVQTRALMFLQMAKQRGLNTGNANGGAMIPIILGNSMKVLRACRELAERGFHVQPLLHPTVEEPNTRLRFFITAQHTEKQLRNAIKATVEVLAKMEAE